MSLAPAAEIDTKQVSNQGGWSAELNCRFEPGPDRTIVRRTHSGPLYMQRPFYPEGPVAHVYMLHPPGGVVAGDVLRVNVSSINGGKGLVSTPGATKFYRSDGAIATISQCLETQGGSLEWFPAENIFFSESSVSIKTEIRLACGDSLAWWEINCFGSYGTSSAENPGSVNSTVNLFIDNKLFLRERVLVDSQHPLSMSCGMRGKRVTGTMVLVPIQEECVDYARKKLAHDSAFSCTYFDSMLVIRYLGDSSEDAKAGFASVWSGLRTALNSMPASLPRIWAT